MKHIVLFGAGKSATELIDYLKKTVYEKTWKLTVADNDKETLQKKVGIQKHVKAVVLNIHKASSRKSLIQQADIVISLLPPALHYLVALDCILFHKHLLTASYVDEQINALKKDIEHRQLLFLCEMGLDPGIDHMSAMRLIQGILKKNGNITSFKSYCGGLVAPESDDNPWHYKISWNPRNVVLAGKTGAAYKINGQEIQVAYEQLFSTENMVQIPKLGSYCFYPNRDSLRYAALYQLENVSTFIRTTIRHPLFCSGWQNIIRLKLTDEEKQYQTNGLSIADFFKQHFEKHGFGQWLNEMMLDRLKYVTEIAEELTTIIKTEEEKDTTDENFLVVDEKGELNTKSMEEVKDEAAQTMANEIQQAHLIMKQLFYLGLDDTDEINQGICSAADILQYLLERKLYLHAKDKDMVVMMHEIEYEQEGKPHLINSSLIVKGKDNLHTAMAKTVGLPLGIAAKLILEGKINETGLHIPVSTSIYEPVLQELQQHGIHFEEMIS